MKKLINDPEAVVREALEGMEAAHQGAIRVQYDPYVVVRADAPVSGKVGIYSATSGKLLWSFDAHTGVMAQPITYLVGGKQYITVISGWRSSVEKLMRNVAAYGRTTQAMNVPRAKKKSATGIHGRAVRRSAGVRPGETNAQPW